MFREMGEKKGRSALLWRDIAEALGVGTITSGKEACNILADLIDPDIDVEDMRVRQLENRVSSIEETLESARKDETDRFKSDINGMRLKSAIAHVAFNQDCKAWQA